MSQHKQIPYYLFYGSHLIHTTFKIRVLKGLELRNFNLMNLNTYGPAI